MTVSRPSSLPDSYRKDSPSLEGWRSAVSPGVREIPMSKYSELLKDPRWQKMRLKKLEAAEWRCQLCWDDEAMLSVHHKRYVKARMPWDYPEHELVVLCQPCHEAEHEQKELRQELLGALHVDGPASTGDFFAIGAGYVSEQTNDEVMQAIARQFGGEHPYQFEAGRFLAGLDFMRASVGELSFMADELLKNGPSELRDELIALFCKHKARREGSQG